jgi:hypothetical protein
MASRDLSRTCTGSEGSSHHEIELDDNVCFERLRRKVKARFQLLVVRTVHSPRGVDQPGVLPSPRRVASSSSSSSRKPRMSVPSSSRAGASATLYSAYFSAAIRWTSGSVCAEESGLCPLLVRDAESRSSCTSSSLSAKMVSRILRSDESSSYWGWRYEWNVPSNRTDKIEIDDEAPCYSLGLERSGRVEELELYDTSEREKRGKNICGYTRTSNRMCGPAIELAGEEENDGTRTFEGRTLAAFTLPQEEDPDVGSALFELCTLCAQLLINCITDTLS